MNCHNAPKPGSWKGGGPPPPPKNTCVTGDCIVWGDPHIITFDVHHKRYLEHPDREAFFRARYWKNASNASWTNLGSLAVGGPFLKNNTFVIRPLAGKVTWNGGEVLSHLGSEFSNDLIHAKYHKDT